VTARNPGEKSMGKAFAGKSVVITGSTSGIGLGIARAFAGEGANVMLNGLGELAAIEATRAGLEASSACARATTAPT
jgi:3-hydroxybutyrate dehydrogenase